jgi:uncharacterized membrane protein YphA (DoxX/SURF4 family)
LRDVAALQPGEWYIPTFLSSEGEEAMHIALWIVQILLALAFALSGFGKVSLPVEKLRESFETDSTPSGSSKLLMNRG